jgi:aminoglycoside phosphotransferase
MNIQAIKVIFNTKLQHMPQSFKRCAVGIGNEVYIVECDNGKYIFRCSTEENAYAETIHWLTELSVFNIPIPKVLFHGTYGEYQYLILDFIPGEDIGLVYTTLTTEEKKQIAKNVMDIQRKVARLQLTEDTSWSWQDFVNEMLDRAVDRITQNGYFDIGKVTRIREEMMALDGYFSMVKPVTYLDDISTKNLLIHNGAVSGVIDIDWMGVGDNLTFIAMTYVALKNMDCETDYVDYLLEERGCTDEERRAFLFYCLMFCVDFMGERGMQFGDKTIEANNTVIDRLNRIYEELWEGYGRISECK